MKKTVMLVVSICHFLLARSQSLINYFNSVPPGNVPILFAPGAVSDGFANRDFAISPAGDEIFFTIQQRDIVSAVMHIYKKAGKWSEPEVASFSGICNDLEVSFTADGSRLYFSSNRPLNLTDSTKDYNIWYVERINGSWADPVPLGPTINTEKDEFYPSVSKNGNLYFTTQFETGKGKEDIVVSEWRNNEYQPPVSLPGAINSKGFEFNAFVDPDEQFILFTAYARNDDLGKGDLYISVKKNGEWQPAVNLGKNINSPYIDYCPFVSWDKKYLFFTSGRVIYKAPFNQKQTVLKLKRGLQSPGNGLDDIYWVRFDTLLHEMSK